jgi:hypothetical protein
MALLKAAGLSALQAIRKSEQRACTDRNFHAGCLLSNGKSCMLPIVLVSMIIAVGQRQFTLAMEH